MVLSPRAYFRPEMETWFEIVQKIMEIGLCGVIVSLLVFSVCVIFRWLVAKRSKGLCMRLDLAIRWSQKLLRWSFNSFAVAYFFMMTWSMVAGLCSLLGNHSS